jgi:hypothetical protein
MLLISGNAAMENAPVAGFVGKCREGPVSGKADRQKECHAIVGRKGHILPDAPVIREGFDWTLLE